MRELVVVEWFTQGHLDAHSKSKCHVIWANLMPLKLADIWRSLSALRDSEKFQDSSQVIQKYEFVLAIMQISIQHKTK